MEGEKQGREPNPPPNLEFSVSSVVKNGFRIVSSLAIILSGRNLDACGK